MSKTIKVIDLLNKIAKGKEVPQYIKYAGNIFEFDKLEKTYFTTDFDKCEVTELDIYIKGCGQKSLNIEVEIIEEQIEIDIQSIEKIKPHVICGDKYLLDNNTNTINMLIQAVKQLDKQINNK
jgi:hypothetical protein